MSELCPITLRTARDFVREHHRHNDPQWGHKFSIGLTVDGVLVGVVTVGRPIARAYWRAVAWLVDNMIDGKPSDLSDVLKHRETKISKKLDIAKKLRDYNQPTPTLQKAKKKTHSHDDR